MGEIAAEALEGCNAAELGGDVEIEAGIVKEEGVVEKEQRLEDRGHAAAVVGAALYQEGVLVKNGVRGGVLEWGGIEIVVYD